MKNLNKLLYAASYAAQKHTAQRRKGERCEPYINHPLEVANLIANIGAIDDAEILTAALLHDIVEDCGVSNGEIAEIFGERIASYVAEVTDDKSLEKAERKRLQIEHAPHLSSGAKVIKLADKISNVKDMTDSPPDWPMERRSAYIDWSVAVVAGLRGVNGQLESRFDSQVQRARRELSL